jgi:hypothetical protein
MTFLCKSKIATIAANLGCRLPPFRYVVLLLLALGLVFADASHATTALSLNRYVKRSIAKTNIPSILGTCSSAYGGATESCGGYKNHPRNIRVSPSQVNSSTWAVVELDNVFVRSEGRKYWGNGDGDACIGLEDRSFALSRNLYHRAIHAELDWGWRTYLTAQPGATYQSKFGNLAAGTRIDVQGLVYWDSYHTTAAWHWYSGWEIHPVFAWRPHTTTASAAWRYIYEPGAQDLSKIIFGGEPFEDEGALSDKAEAGD